MAYYGPGALVGWMFTLQLKKRPQIQINKLNVKSISISFSIDPANPSHPPPPLIILEKSDLNLEKSQTKD